MDLKQQYKKQALAKVDELREEAIGLLSSMIRIPSFNPPGNEKAMGKFNADYLRALGLKIEQIEPVENRVSFVARMSGKKGTPTLLFNSHLDTFPPGDPKNWKYPPFSGEVREGSIWGIGAKNMKSGMASAVFATNVIKVCGIELMGDLLLAQSADEIQLGDVGIKALLDRGMVKADVGIYTECDPPLKVEIAHRGMVWLDITARGIATHTAYDSGINAIGKMSKVIQAITNMKFVNWKPHPYLPGEPRISPNMISGGFASNQIADRCTLRCDCRFIPPQTPESVMEEVKRELDRLQKEDPQLNLELSVDHQAKACSISPDEPIVKATQRAIKEVTGRDIPAGGVGTTSDQRWLVEAGIPTCKFAFVSSTSGANEHVTIEDYLNTIKVYLTLIIDLLM